MDNQSIATTSSQTALTPLQRALAKRKNLGSRDILLIDYSGSMASEDSDNRPRIDGARACVAELRNQGFQFTQYVFSDDCILSDIIPDPYSGTNLAGAFRTIASQESGFRRIIVVSDGVPDSVEFAFAEAAKLDPSVVIDTFFIGCPGERGEQFLRELAAKFRGSYGAVSALAQLTAGIAGILTANAESLAEVVNKPIAL